MERTKDGKLIFILKEEKTKRFQIVDNKQIITENDFEILKETPTLFMKLIGLLPQSGVYSHCSSLDFNNMPKSANAVLLSTRYITDEGFEIYAGQYCHLRE